MLLWFESSTQQLIQISVRQENISRSSNTPLGMRDLGLVRGLPRATAAVAHTLPATIADADAIAARIASALGLKSVAVIRAMCTQT